MVVDARVDVGRRRRHGPDVGPIPLELDAAAGLQLARFFPGVRLPEGWVVDLLRLRLVQRWMGGVAATWRGRIVASRVPLYLRRELIHGGLAALRGS